MNSSNSFRSLKGLLLGLLLNLLPMASVQAQEPPLIAGMEPPEKSFAEFLTEHMDSPEEAIELLGSFSKSFKSSEYTVYRLREDLSMPSGDE